ncbi:hypothetical protein CVT25_002070 [Psilocybe cyanescens]|uniref:Uncharacterized protein n=1 Tax=Psilocybe cyanescens TaxID=93625 RepID=A0A409X979_PSICY|nr:hypothetical protein CVT25_002070 [Psilocybe cyanescens]
MDRGCGKTGAPGLHPWVYRTRGILGTNFTLRLIAFAAEQRQIFKEYFAFVFFDDIYDKLTEFIQHLLPLVYNQASPCHPNSERWPDWADPEDLVSDPAARAIATRATVSLYVSIGAGPGTEWCVAIPEAAWGCGAILLSLVSSGGVGEEVFECAALAVGAGGDGLGVICWGGKGDSGEECLHQIGCSKAQLEASM